MQRINALFSGKWSDLLALGSSIDLKNVEIYCNGNQIEVDTDINLEESTITNDQTYSDVVGGELIIEKENCKINANLYSSIQPVIIYKGSSKLTIIGNVTAGMRAAGVPCIINESSGIIEVIGDVKGGQSAYCPGIVNKSDGTIIVNGNIYNGDGQWSYGIVNDGGGKVLLNNNEITDKYIGILYNERNIII